MNVCPQCHSNNVRASTLRSLKERFARYVLLLRPYRCLDCGYRYFQEVRAPRKSQMSRVVKISLLVLLLGASPFVAKFVADLMGGAYNSQLLLSLTKQFTIYQPRDEQRGEWMKKLEGEVLERGQAPGQD